MKGHLTSYKQENVFLIKFGLFLLLFIFFKNCNKTKYLQHKSHSQGALKGF
jgi:hypothetical protein